MCARVCVSACVNVSPLAITTAMVAVLAADRGVWRSFAFFVHCCCRGAVLYQCRASVARHHVNGRCVCACLLQALRTALRRTSTVSAVPSASAFSALASRVGALFAVCFKFLLCLLVFACPVVCHVHFVPRSLCRGLCDDGSRDDWHDFPWVAQVVARSPTLARDVVRTSSARRAVRTAPAVP